MNSRSYGNFIDGKPIDDAALLNVTDLKAMPYPVHVSASFPSVKRFARIAGWLSPGDGGGGIYYWDKDSSAPDNGTTILVPTDYAGQTNGRGLRQPECVLRVADGAIAANTLVKPSTTAGRMSQFLATDPLFLAVGVALDAAAIAGDKIRVVEVKGVLCQIKSDGTTNIASQDLVEPSTTMDGRIRKGSTAPIRIALSASNSTLDELVEVL